MSDPTSYKPALSTLALGLACGIATVICWAAGLVAAKHGIANGLGPADIAFHRNVWAGLLLLPALALRGELHDIAGVGWRRGLVLMVLGGIPFSILSYTGFLLVPLGHGGVIQPSTAALGGTLLSALVLREPLPAARYLGAVAIVTGLVLLGWEALTTIGSHGIIGDLTFAGAGISFATFALLLRMWRISPMRAVVVISVLSLICVPFQWAILGFDRMIAAGWAENLLQIAVQGGLAGAAAIYLFTRSVMLLGAARAALFPALVPAVTMLIGFLTLGEVPTYVQLAGLAVVAIGFRLAMKP